MTNPEHRLRAVPMKVFFLCCLASIHAFMARSTESEEVIRYLQQPPSLIRYDYQTLYQDHWFDGNGRAMTLTATNIFTGRMADAANLTADAHIIGQPPTYFRGISQSVFWKYDPDLHAATFADPAFNSVTGCSKMYGIHPGNCAMKLARLGSDVDFQKCVWSGCGFRYTNASDLAVSYWITGSVAAVNASNVVIRYVWNGPKTRSLFEISADLRPDAGSEIEPCRIIVQQSKYLNGNTNVSDASTTVLTVNAFEKSERGAVLSEIRRDMQAFLSSRKTSVYVVSNDSTHEWKGTGAYSVGMAFPLEKLELDEFLQPKRAKTYKHAILWILASVSISCLVVLMVKRANNKI
jgi:hypothetical protein